MPTTLTVTVEITVPDAAPTGPHGRGWTFGNLATAVQRLTRSPEFADELLMTIAGDALLRAKVGTGNTRTAWVPATADRPGKPGHLAAQVTVRRTRPTD